MEDDLEKMAADAGLTEEETAKLSEMQDAPDPQEVKEDDAELPAEPEVKAEEPEVDKEQPEPPEKPKKKPSIREEMVEYRKRAKEAESKLEEAAKLKEEFDQRDKERETRYAAIIDQIKAERDKKNEQAQQAAEPEAPSIDDNPVDYFNNEIQRLSNVVSQLVNSGQHDAAASAHNQAVVHDISTYRQQAPDYDDAFRHLVDHLDGIYEASGVVDARTRYNLCAEQVRNVTATALSEGKSACDRLYGMAQKVGYVPTEQPAPNGNGKITGEDIDRISKGQNEASGMPGSGDSRPGGLTYSQIADMPSNELNKLVETKYGGSIEKLMAAASANTS